MNKSLQELELEKRIDIADYFNKYVVGKKKGVREISDIQPTSICPFHNESDPSMHYWKSRKRVHCFGCGMTANIVRLHKLTERAFNNRNIDDATAINELINLYNLQGVIKQAVQEAEIPKTAFEMTREKIYSGMLNKLPEDTFTVRKFVQTNQQIISSNMIETARLREFQNLDMLAGLILSGIAEN